MKIRNVIVVALLSLSLLGCTEQIRAKTWGGSTTLEIKKGQKFVNATWKEDDLWIVTRPMADTDVAETYTFYESSSWGMMNGQVTFKESK